MPCYRCGARQVDPAGGPSPWKRGVRAGAQVLVCPDCQHGAGWLSELEHCPRCGSEQLARVLGETICRACRQPVPAPIPAVAAIADEPVGIPEQRTAAVIVGDPGGLAAEVADALDRIFHRK